ncbi:MAG: acyltransferase, partial [Lysobacterales bacterium]
MVDPPAHAAAIAPTRTIADCIAAGRNNFLLLRFLAAGLVLFGHSWAIALNPSGESDWLAQRTLLFSGTLAVNMFFFVSGFLVTMSYERRHSLWAFGKARVLRIFPALLVCVALSAVVLGPIVSTLSPAAYFGDPQWWRYLIGNASLLDLQWKLAGVFTTNRHPDIVNGALWTLPGEMQMYVYVAALGVLGLLRTRSRFGFALAALLIVAVWFRDRVPMVSQAEYYGFAAFFAFGA